MSAFFTKRDVEKDKYLIVKNTSFPSFTLDHSLCLQHSLHFTEKIQICQLSQ